jgi:hypothetical protein
LPIGRNNRPGIPEIEAKRYDERLKAANYLSAGHFCSDAGQDRAQDIFKQSDAEAISTSSMSSDQERSSSLGNYVRREQPRVEKAGRTPFA